MKTLETAWATIKLIFAISVILLFFWWVYCTWGIIIVILGLVTVFSICHKPKEEEEPKENRNINILRRK